MEEPASGFGLVERPVRDGGLVFSDVPSGGAHRLREYVPEVPAAPARVTPAPAA